jgi:hypothetical protein
MKFKSCGYRQIRYRTLTTICLGISSLSGVANADDWPTWRGPDGRGVAKESALPSEWKLDGEVSNTFATNQDGSVKIFTASPEYKLLATNKLDENTNASPAIVDDRMYIRTDKHLWCIGPS